jgi:hypothetical protein
VPGRVYLFDKATSKLDFISDVAPLAEGKSACRDEAGEVRVA